MITPGAFGNLPGGRELAELAREVSACGRSLWVVGGAVRDMLLGRPVDEVDLVTDLPLDDLGRLLRIHAVGRGRDFGTVVAVVGGRPFEVSELRGGTSGEDPVDTRLSADAGCRDFTVNALYLDRDGRVLDCVGGRDDLHGAIIRGVGDPGRRFEEDPVRIIRGVRLAVQLGFAIEPATARAMTARAGLLAGVPGERLARELIKMAALGGSALAGGVELMRENVSLAVVLPEVAALAGAEHRSEHHPEGDAYRHTLAALRSWEGRDPLTGLAILLHDIGKGPPGSRVGGAGRYPGHARAGAGMVPDLVGRLRLPGAWAESLAFVADRHMLLHRLGELRPSTLRRLVADPGWRHLREVALADVAARGDVGRLERLREEIRRGEEIARTAEERYRRTIKGAVSGRRVMEVTGLPPGRRVGEIIDRVTAWALDAGVVDGELLDEAVRRAHRGEE